jgi:hypothetical protein
MSPPALSAGTSTGSSDIPFTRAFRWENHSHCPSCSTVPTPFLPGYHANQPWVRTQHQLDKIYPAQLHGSRDNLKHRRALNNGVANFLATAAPTAEDLIEHTQGLHSDTLCQSTATCFWVTTLEICCVTATVWESVQHEYMAMEAAGVYGWIDCDKPDDVI